MTRFFVIALFMLLMLLSQAVFLLHCPRRKPFFLRCAAAFAGFLAAASALDAVFGRLPQTVPFRIAYFLLFTSFSLPAIRFSFQLSIRKATFIAVAGYSLQHIADSILKILQTVPAMAQIHWLLTTACVYAAVLSLGYLVFTKGAQLEEAMRYGDWRVLAVSWTNLVMCLGISVVIDDLALTGTVLVICKIYAILGCLLCLCFQVGLFQNGRMAQEKRTLMQMMEMERRQHQLSKETIDIINIKCHDMKHQIERLAAQPPEKQSQSLARLSQAIMIYDSMLSSGSDALNTILMEKKLLCESYQIRFSFLGDGGLLAAVEDMDIYSLFGNIMDNAIESLRQEPDPEKRLLSLRISRHNRMVYICADNYCSTPLVYVNGELQTTKQHEPGMHGYGVKSIGYIVDSYKGDLAIHTENEHFILEILLPILDTAAKS